MTQSSSATSRGRHVSPVKTTTAGGLVLASLVAIYSFAQPLLNERMGWNLPSLAQSTVSESKTSSTPAAAPRPQTTLVQDREAASEQGTIRENKTSESAKSAEAKPGPLAGRVPVPVSAPKSSPASQSGSSTKTGERSTQKSDSSDPTLRYGLLKDLGGERYVSPAGLLYTRGSAEGHRLNHLERHTVDDPGRPGKHGVFDGGMEGALKWIDRAYERAKTGQRTTKEVDQGRIIYTVDMGSRVGYIGGRDGNRTKKPMARRVRLVLDDNRVITAFPL